MRLFSKTGDIHTPPFDARHPLVIRIWREKFDEVTFLSPHFSPEASRRNDVATRHGTGTYYATSASRETGRPAQLQRGPSPAWQRGPVSRANRAAAAPAPARLQRGPSEAPVGKLGELRGREQATITVTLQPTAQPLTAVPETPP